MAAPDGPETREPKASKAPVARLQLEMEPEDFMLIQDAFVGDLAGAMGLSEEQLRILEIRPGCTQVFVAFDDAPDDVVLLLLRVDAESDEHHALRRVFKKYAVTSVTEIKRFLPPYVGKFVEEHAFLAEEGQRLTWLHLSDLHARVGDGAHFQDEVTSSFVDDLPRLLDEWELQPDIVFMSGDVAFSGKADEYRAARVFLEKVVAALPTVRRLFVVPGNHDVTWGAVDPRRDEELDEELRDHERVADFFHGQSDEDEARRKLVRLRLDNFANFLATLETPPHPSMEPSGYYYALVVEHEDFNVGVAGLNSAWRSTTRAGRPDRSDWQRLLIGASQLRETISQVGRADIRIALVHHPPDTDWFKAFDRNAHRSMLPSFDFVLRGHEHSAGALGVRTLGGGTEQIQMPAGALYSADESTPKTFNVVRLNLTTGRGVAFFWRYFEESFKWRADVALAEHGRAFFKMPAVPDRRSTSRDAHLEATPATTSVGDQNVAILDSDPARGEESRVQSVDVTRRSGA